jgi:DNA-directed RNA polymerase specialized sigma24 family protein
VLCGAWEGVRRAKGYNPATAARRGIIDRIRTEREVGGRGKARREHLDPAAFDALLARAPGPDEAARRWELWEEVRGAWAAAPVRTRVMVYLWVAEGWPLRRVGAAFGVGEVAVHSAIRRGRA